MVVGRCLCWLVLAKSGKGVRGDDSGTRPYGLCRSCAGCVGFTHAVSADRHSDADRREWILNDEGLYRWAKLEGVRI